MQGDARDPGSIPGLERYPGRGNGSSLQYFCLGNSVDRILVGCSLWGCRDSDTTESWNTHTVLIEMQTCGPALCQMPHCGVGSSCFPVLQMRKLRHISLSHITPSDPGCLLSSCCSFPWISQGPVMLHTRNRLPFAWWLPLHGRSGQNLPGCPPLKKEPMLLAGYSVTGDFYRNYSSNFHFTGYFLYYRVSTRCPER